MDARAVQRLCRPARQPVMSFDQAIESLHAFTPRCRFVKTLPLGAALLDAGAGDGSLQVYRRWPQPSRADLHMFAWAFAKGTNFDLYDGSETGFWPDHPPDFSGRSFDAILAVNFIEHIDDPIAFVKWSIARLNPGGRLFLEWPTPRSVTLPTTAELAALGLPIMTGNYFDDATHRPDVPDFGAVRDAIVGAGLTIQESGTVAVPFFDQEVAIHAAKAGDTVNLTLAYWSLTGWCQYLIAERSSQSSSRSGATA
jgi:SAM-dependent methyltransferase